MPITGLGQSPIAGQAQAPEEAWSWPRIAPRGEGGIEASGLERSCMSARLAAGRRCARNRSGLELGPYGLTSLSLSLCTVIGISRFWSATMRA